MPVDILVVNKNNEDSSATYQTVSNNWCKIFGNVVWVTDDLIKVESAWRMWNEKI